MRPKGGFEKLMKDNLFVNSLVGIVIDEAHCILQWGSFRPEYRHIGQLCYLPRKLRNKLCRIQLLSFLDILPQNFAYLWNK